MEIADNRMNREKDNVRAKRITTTEMPSDFPSVTYARQECKKCYTGVDVLTTNCGALKLMLGGRTDRNTRVLLKGDCASNKKKIRKYETENALVDSDGCCLLWVQKYREEKRCYNDHLEFHPNLFSLNIQCINVDKLNELNVTLSNFSNLGFLCFTETWAVDDSVGQLALENPSETTRWNFEDPELSGECVRKNQNKHLQLIRYGFRTEKLRFVPPTNKKN
nr:unnamed protein product [Callosobruchus analis]